MANLVEILMSALKEFIVDYKALQSLSKLTDEHIQSKSAYISSLKNLIPKEEDC